MVDIEYRTKYFSEHTLAGYNYSDSTGAGRTYTGTPDAPFNFIDLVALAKLARLEVDAQEMAKLKKEIPAILVC